MQFLTPGFFDLLVVIALIIAIMAVIIRAMGDFRRGPRWPEDLNAITSDNFADEDLEAEPTGEPTDD